MIKLFKYIVYIIIITMIAIMGLSLSVMGVFYYYGSDLPNHEALAIYHPDLSSRVFLKNGKLLTEFATEKRYYIPIAMVPEKLINAFLAAEDKNFYEHVGIDFLGILRSVLKNILNIGKGIRPKGASTITQQVARIFFLSNEASYIRKIKEAILAFRIEFELSKDQILELYLNQIFLGKGCYGVAAAARQYFNKSLDELTISECAYIASLAKGANNYHPIHYKEKAIIRRNWVIKRLYEDGVIDYQTAFNAMQEKLYIANQQEEFVADYFNEEIRKNLIKQFKFDHLSKEGLIIRATLDEKLQIIATNALLNGLEKFERKSAWKGPIAKINISIKPTKEELAQYQQLCQEKEALKEKLLSFNVFEIKSDTDMDNVKSVKELKIIVSDADILKNKNSVKISFNDDESLNKLKSKEYDKYENKDSDEALISKTGSDMVVEQVANNQLLSKTQTDNSNKATENVNSQYVNTHSDSESHDVLLLSEKNAQIDVYNNSLDKEINEYNDVRVKYIQILQDMSNHKLHNLFKNLKLITKPAFSKRSIKGVILNKSYAVLTENNEEVKLSENDISWIKTFARPLEVGDVVLLIKKEDKYILFQVPEVQGAIIVMDPQTGRILAMHGGYDFEHSKFNRATQSSRQIGSLFKPFVYMAALESGFQPNMLINGADTSYFMGKGLPLWTPRNIRKVQIGNITLRSALERSVNTVTVKIANQIGMKKIRQICRKFGIYDNLPLYLSASLGSFENTLLNITTAYAKILNGGKKIQPTFVDYVQTRNGEVLDKTSVMRMHDFYDVDANDKLIQQNQALSSDEQTINENIQNNNALQFFNINTKYPPLLIDTREQIFDPITIYQMQYLLQGVIERGSGASAKSLNRILAGKTGTSNESRDVWIVIGDPDIIIGVFVGYDNQNKNLGKETGSSVALPIAVEFLEMFMRDKPSIPFPVPHGIVFKKINRFTGKLAQASDSDVIMEAFRDDKLYREELSLVDSLSLKKEKLFNENYQFTDSFNVTQEKHNTQSDVQQDFVTDLNAQFGVTENDDSVDIKKFDE